MFWEEPRNSGWWPWYVANLLWRNMKQTSLTLLSCRDHPDTFHMMHYNVGCRATCRYINPASTDYKMHDAKAVLFHGPFFSRGLGPSGASPLPSPNLATKPKPFSRLHHPMSTLSKNTDACLPHPCCELVFWAESPPSKHSGKGHFGASGNVCVNQHGLRMFIALLITGSQVCVCIQHFPLQPLGLDCRQYTTL